IDGWRVLEHLKGGLGTRHIPVWVISTEEATERGLGLGAAGVVAKPIKTRETLEQVLEAVKAFADRPTRELLVAVGDPADESRLLDLVEGDGAHLPRVASGKDALNHPRQRPMDCVVLTPPLPDLSLAAIAEEWQRESPQRDCPVLVYAAGELAVED